MVLNRCNGVLDEKYRQNYDFSNIAFIIRYNRINQSRYSSSYHFLQLIQLVAAIMAGTIDTSQTFVTNCRKWWPAYNWNQADTPLPNF